MSKNKKDTWETDEVIRHLINDEYCYNELLGKDADEIERFVLDRQAPEELYESFDRPPKSTFDDVDWDEVADSLTEEEDEEEDEEE